MATLTLAGVAPLLRGEHPASLAPDRIDLSAVEWATPYDVAVLAAIWMRQRQNGLAVAVDPRRDPKVRDYLVGVGLAKIIEADWDRSSAGAGDPSLIPLMRVASGDAWDEQQPELWAVRTVCGPAAGSARSVDTPRARQRDLKCPPPAE